MKRTMTIALTLAFLLLSAADLAGCGSQERVLPVQEAGPVLAYSEAKTDNLMQAINAGDYKAFSRDLDEAMRGAIPESKWQGFLDDIRGKVGDYQSRNIESVRQSGEFYAVVYVAKFSKLDNVTLRVVYRAAEPHAISGLWYK